MSLDVFLPCSMQSWWSSEMFNKTDSFLELVKLQRSQKSLGSPVESGTEPAIAIFNPSQAHYFSKLH